MIREIFYISNLKKYYQHRKNIIQFKNTFFLCRLAFGNAPSLGDHYNSLAWMSNWQWMFTCSKITAWCKYVFFSDTSFIFSFLVHKLFMLHLRIEIFLFRLCLDSYFIKNFIWIRPTKNTPVKLRQTIMHFWDLILNGMSGRDLFGQLLSCFEIIYIYIYIYIYVCVCVCVCSYDVVDTVNGFRSISVSTESR